MTFLDLICSLALSCLVEMYCKGKSWFRQHARISRCVKLDIFGQFAVTPKLFQRTKKRNNCAMFTFQVQSSCHLKILKVRSSIRKKHSIFRNKVLLLFDWSVSMAEGCPLHIATTGTSLYPWI